MVLNKKKKIHFVGIGGIGMSGIATVLSEMGYKVSGSDLELNDLTKKIESLGGRVFKGHSSSNIPEGAGILVYSSAISEDNPELLEARRRRIKMIHRAEVLGVIFNARKGIAITGTHGKTTTTSLISVMLENTGRDPTAIIGGEVKDFNGNAKLGKGIYAVCEADESDSSFLHLKPFYAVITNIEMEHMDHYKTLDDVKRSYRSFIGNLKKGGTVFYNRDDLNSREILKNHKGKTRSFGLHDNADIYPVDIKMNGFTTSFKCVYKGRALGRAEIKIPGTHNVLNALAAILVGMDLGLDFKDIVNSIKDFSGAKRRFQLRSDADNIMLIDDYAHHPTEIRAVLDTCRNWKDRRVIVVFQPHRYTRTKFLQEEFGKCFRGADKLILTDIYAASEKAIRGVSIKNIYDRVKANGVEDVVIVKKENIPEYIMRVKKRGDMVLILGAGDIKKIADELHKRFSLTRLVDGSIISELKNSVKGDIKINEDLSRHSSLKIGGPADIWFEPHDAKDLKKTLMFAKRLKTPIFVIGNGSNLLVSDSGYRGMLIHLGARPFQDIEIKRTRIRVGAGYSLARLVRICCDKGLGGIESLIGIPGTVGGAIYMNAGGSTSPIYKNIGDLVVSLKVMDYDGVIKTLKRKDLYFGYRCSNLDRYIILEATLKLDKGEGEILRASSSRFLKMKRDKQVLDMPSAGCVFKNPRGFQFTCGQMIDMLGLKGKRIGGAEVSEKHANFIINREAATCKDVMALIEFIKTRVRDNYGIPLELEIKVI